MKPSADLPTPRALNARPIPPPPRAPRGGGGPCEARWRGFGGAIMLALALALSACADARHARPEASVTTPMTSQDFEKALAYWGPRYTANPKDKATELNYAAALRRLDRPEQAAAVLQKAAIYHPSDREVLAAYGKALASIGDFTGALSLVQRAQTPDQPDWKLLSAEAAIRNQIGQHAEARQLYKQALQLVPDEPSVQKD